MECLKNRAIWTSTETYLIMRGVWARAFLKYFRDESRVLDEDDVEHGSGLGIVTLNTSFFGGTLAIESFCFLH